MKQIGSRVVDVPNTWCSVRYLNPDRFPSLNDVVSRDVQYEAGVAVWAGTGTMTRDQVWWSPVMSVAGVDEVRLTFERFNGAHWEVL